MMVADCGLRNFNKRINTNASDKLSITDKVGGTDSPVLLAVRFLIFSK